MSRDNREYKPPKCGFCLTGHHEHCRIETLPWYGKTWKCACPCDKSKIVPIKYAGTPLRARAVPVVVPDPDPEVVRKRGRSGRARRVAEQEMEKAMLHPDIVAAREEYR